MSESIFLQIIFAAIYMACVNFDIEVVKQIEKHIIFEQNELVPTLNFTSIQVIKTIDIEILVLTFGIIMSTGFIFVYCYVGSSTTDHFWQYGDVSYDSLWYVLPINLQQCLRLIIADAQRPRVFTGLGIIDLNLSLFAQVLSINNLIYLWANSRISCITGNEDWHQLLLDVQKLG